MNKGKLKNRKREKEMQLMSSMAKEPEATDVLGSYTGTPRDGGKPDQDADDL